MTIIDSSLPNNFLIVSVIVLIFVKENSGEGGSGDSDSDNAGKPAEKRIRSAVSYTCMYCLTLTT